MRFTVVYLVKWITAFHKYASAALCSIWNVRSSQTLHNVCGRWVLCAASNETTVHCVLLNWRAWVGSRNLRNPPTYTTGPDFTSEVGLHYFVCGRWSKFFQGVSIFCSKLSSGGSLFIKKLALGGNQFRGFHFYRDWTLPKEVRSAACTVVPANKVVVFFFCVYTHWPPQEHKRMGS